jgi:ribose transport system ATP-binding protein
MAAGGAPAADDGAPVLLARGVTKRYADRAVLRDVDLAVHRGEVHALVGANGSGKSTLVKILAGHHAASDAAELRVDGMPYPTHADAPALAKLGLRVVHQDLGLIGELPILENVALAVGYDRRGPIVDWRATRSRVRAALAVVGLQRDLDVPVGELAAWERAAVAFARVVYHGLATVRVLILDEVTAALARDQVVEVLSVVRRLRDQASGILYVTHRFEEVFEIADRVTVLRDGSVIASGPIAKFSVEQLVTLVAGHAIAAHGREAPTRRGDPVLKVSGLRSPRLHGVSFSVSAGEVCGVIGRAGCGRSALGRAIVGLEPLSAGEVRLRGAVVRRPTVARMIGLGGVYVPQDRLREGIIPQASVRENLTLADLAGVSSWGLIRRPRERAAAASLIDAAAMIEHLSGGNQQKVVVARWMTRGRALFVLDEPTEGVDAGARSVIYGLIRRACDAGAAVLLLSSSIEEVVEICDRALFLNAGALESDLHGDRLSVAHIEELLLVGEPHERSADPVSAPASGSQER